MLMFPCYIGLATKLNNSVLGILKRHYITKGISKLLIVIPYSQFKIY